MSSISGSYRVGVVTMFNREKKFGFVRTEAGDKFFFHLHQYCDVHSGNAGAMNLLLARALPETAPKEGMEIVFWTARETLKEGKSPSIADWTYQSAWDRARSPAQGREAGKKSSHG